MKRQQRLTERLLGQQQANKPFVALLLDPDKLNASSLTRLLPQMTACGVSAFFLGGSLVAEYRFRELIAVIRAHCDIPVALFPGNALHIVPEADAILFLTLISGRNPELLIGQHVVAAPVLAQTNLEIVPTGYMLIDTGTTTAAHYMSQTVPIPGNKPEIAAYTALAGTYLGLQLIYLDAGSGAKEPVATEMIRAVVQRVEKPVLVGGGIRDMASARAALDAGAAGIVIGNATETAVGLDFIAELGQYIHALAAQ
jgi:phosphoglycerol geranylgeranyltransferase